MTDERSGDWKPYLALLFMPLFFSTNIIFGRAATASVEPWTLAFIRWTLAFLILLPFTWAGLKRHKKLLMSEWKTIGVLGILGMWICGALVYYALHHTTATNATLIYTSAPVLILLLIASLGTLLSAWQMRNFRFPAALLPLFLPLFIERVQHLKSMRPALAVLIPPILLLGLFAISVKPDGRHLTLIDYMEGDACAEADLAVLADLPPSRIMAPLGLSLTLSEHISKTGSGHKVAALPFHRASAGMERMFQTFVLTDTKLRRDALAPYDFVAVCTLPDTGNTPSQAPVFAALSSGKDWPGLTDVSKPGASRFRLLAIEHASVE